MASTAAGMTGWSVRWGRLAGRELSTIVITIFGLLLVTFLIARVIPIDPVLAVVGDNAKSDVYDAARISLGLDKPLWWQFGVYVGKVFTGDLGKSVLTSNLVVDDIKRVFPATLELATLGTLIGIVLGIPFGVLAAVYQGRWPDQIARFVGLFGYSIPIFWLGLMGLLLFYAKLGWVGGPGRLGVAYQDFVDTRTGVLLIDAAMQGEWDAFWDAWSHLILPSAVLGLFSLAYISRMTRSFMITELQQQYVIAARVKGMSEARVIWRHALRNAFVPARHGDCAVLCEPTRRLGADRDDIRLAGSRPLHHELAAQRRHERRARRHARRRRGLHRRQPILRHPGPDRRSADAVRSGLCICTIFSTLPFNARCHRKAALCQVL